MVKRTLLIVFAVLVIASAAFAGGQGEDQVLKVAHFYDPASGGAAQANTDWFEAISEQFIADNPGWTVEFEVFQWDQIDVKAMADHRAGIEDHDVFLTSPQLMAQHSLVGSLADMSEFLDRDWTQADIEDFSWAAPWKKAEIGGELLGIPLGAHTRVLLYNMEMFEEVGLDPNRPPENLDEVFDYAQRLTRDTDGDGQTDVYGLGLFMGPSRATIELAMSNLIWHFGGELWDPETKQATFASEEGIRSAEVLHSMVHEYGVVPKSALAGTYDDAVLNSFLNGDIAMAWGFGSYWIQVLEEQGYWEGYFPPTASGRAIRANIAITPTDVQAQFTNAWMVSMYSRSDAKEQAWDFINLMLEPENVEQYPDAGLPIRQSLWTGAGMQTDFYQVWQAAVENGRPMPPTAHYGELADTVAAALQQIMVDDADIERTLRTAQDEYNAQYGGQ